MRLRAADERDLDAVMAIQAACYPRKLCEDAEILRTQLRFSDLNAVACDDAGRIVAYMLAGTTAENDPPAWNSPYPERPRRDCVFIRDVAVLPDRRRCGIAPLLLRRLSENPPAPTAFLIAVRGAQSYWQTQGFIAAAPPASDKQAGALASYGEPAVLMTKSLIVQAA